MRANAAVKSPISSCETFFFWCVFSFCFSQPEGLVEFAAKQL
jgi:hypothetical protein